ncbi:MAG: metal ABC transporter permease [Thermomicrobiales bacterium]
MIELLTDPWTYPFMQRAFLEITIIGIATGLVGAFVVLRGLAFIGDALIHAVFPGLVLATILGYDIMLGAFIFGGATALGIGLASRNRRVSHDAAIGVIFAAFFAVGIIMVSARRGYSAEVTSLLFGNILAIDERDIAITAFLALAVVAAGLIFKRVFILIAFDRTLAASSGYPGLPSGTPAAPARHFDCRLQSPGDREPARAVAARDPGCRSAGVDRQAEPDDRPEYGDFSRQRNRRSLHLVSSGYQRQRIDRPGDDRRLSDRPGLRPAARLSQPHPPAPPRRTPRAPLPRTPRAPRD